MSPVVQVIVIIAVGVIVLAFGVWLTATDPEHKATAAARRAQLALLLAGGTREEVAEAVAGIEFETHAAEALVQAHDGTCGRCGGDGWVQDLVIVDSGEEHVIDGHCPDCDGTGRGGEQLSDGAVA